MEKSTLLTSMACTCLHCPAPGAAWGCQGAVAGSYMEPGENAGDRATDGSCALRSWRSCSLQMGVV